MATATSNHTEKLFTGSFLLVCFATLVTFTSFYLLLPTLPVYVVQLQGSEVEVGLVFSALTVTGVLFRPVVGVQSDKRGRRTIMIIGLVGFLISMLLYLLVSSIPAMIVLRLFHGVAWAAATTSFSTLIADMAPPSRRGEAIGFFGISSNLAMAIGPALGMFIINRSSFTNLFVVCAGLALVGLVAGWRIPETRGASKRHASGEVSPRASGPRLAGLFPAFTVLLITISYGSVVSFLPLYARAFGVDNPGLFFTVFAVVVLISRPLFGRLSDRYGRAMMIVPGIALVAVSMIVLSLSGSFAYLALTGLLFGLGFGAAQPSLMALAVDRVAPQARGKAMGFFTSAFDLGIAFGSVIMGFTIPLIGFGNSFLVGGAVASLALLAVIFREKRTIFQLR